MNDLDIISWMGSRFDSSCPSLITIQRAAQLWSSQIPLLGSHQVENAAIAYTALKASGIQISDEAIQKGFAQVKWPARFELLRRSRLWSSISAHNRDSFVKSA